MTSLLARLEPEQKEQLKLLVAERERRKVINKARISLWEFCKLLAPDFYKDDREYLKTYCDTLQALYEGRLQRKDGKPYTNLIVEMPPRHGKSRTLTLFNAWVLGINENNRIVTASFNDDLAQSFSRNTRDIICEKQVLPTEIVYANIFDARIKKGNSSFQEWALEGQFFSYKGAGVGGSITGKGGNILEMDDLVKDAATAYNENELEKIWSWYTGTFLSRAEKGIKILSMTPWSSKDTGARLQAKQKDKWFILRFPACIHGNMLCEDILSHEEYIELKAIGDTKIITANYDLERIDVQGSLYGSFNTYSILPDSPEAKAGYCDTADEGKDYLCAIYGNTKNGLFYVTDVVYTQEAQEITEPLVSGKLKDNGTKQFKIESNNGGRAFARNVERIARDIGISCSIEWFHQSENKQSRIFTNAPLVKSKIIMPEGWEHKWSEFYTAVIGFQRDGKNKHDDAPDCLTGIVEKFLSENTVSQKIREDMAALRRR
jgi:predicted phage terminase large subunit-like protein